MSEKQRGSQRNNADLELSNCEQQPAINNCEQQHAINNCEQQHAMRWHNILGQHGIYRQGLPD